MIKYFLRAMISGKTSKGILLAGISLFFLSFSALCLARNDNPPFNDRLLTPRQIYTASSYSSIPVLSGNNVVKTGNSLDQALEGVKFSQTPVLADYRQISEMSNLTGPGTAVNSRRKARESRSWSNLEKIPAQSDSPSKINSGIPMNISAGFSP